MYRIFAEHHQTVVILMKLLQNTENTSLLSQVCIILTNLSHDELFSKKMFKQYELLKIVNVLLQKYFLGEFFSEMCQREIELLNDLLWLTNNFIIHEN